jgi:hypothetical protein
VSQSQEAPDELFLAAVADFLDGDVRPTVGDKALRFRLLIASSLLRSVASERARDAELREAEVERLGVLLGATAPWDLDELNALLVSDIRDVDRSAAADAEIRGHLLETLRERLAVRNPRFDRSAEIE